MPTTCVFGLRRKKKPKVPEEKLQDMEKTHKLHTWGAEIILEPPTLEEGSRCI